MRPLVRNTPGTLAQAILGLSVLAHRAHLAQPFSRMNDATDRRAGIGRTGCHDSQLFHLSLARGNSHWTVLTGPRLARSEIGAGSSASGGPCSGAGHSLGCGCRESGLLSILWIRPGSRPTRIPMVLVIYRPASSFNNNFVASPGPSIYTTRWTVVTESLPHWSQLQPVSYRLDWGDAFCVCELDRPTCWKRSSAASAAHSALCLNPQSAGPWLRLHLIATSQRQTIPQDPRLHM